MPEAIPVVGSVVGGIMGSDAADDAARAQERAANAAAEAQLEGQRLAIDEQRRQFDVSRQDQAPWLNTGGAALNRLATMMGVVPTNTGTPAPTMMTEAEIRQELLPQFTSDDNLPALRLGEQYAINPQTGEISAVSWSNPGGHGESDTGNENYPTYRAVDEADQGGGIDEAGLSAAVQQRLQQQQQAQQQWQAQQSAAQSAARSDPEFNSLMRRFTLDDYVEDPGYQFRLKQGEQAINRAAAAAGRYDSGRALKDLTEFNSGLASQEYGNAYSRFTNDQSNQFNRLASLAGVGQTAANTLAGLGSNTSANISSLLASGGQAQANAAIGAGNARASGYMGANNAWQGAIGGATNALAQYFTPGLNVRPGLNLNATMGGNQIANPTFSTRW